MSEQKVIGIVGSRTLNHKELLEVEKLVIELMNSGFYILSDGSRTVGLKVMETAYRIDPQRIFVYLHCKIKRNPSVTHKILNKIPKEQVLEIGGPYNDRNIFYRNKIFVKRCDLVVAFWKENSTDVQDVIQRCNKEECPVPVIPHYL